MVLTSKDKKKEKKKRKFECEKRKLKVTAKKEANFFSNFKSTTHTLAKIHCGPDWKNREIVSVGDVLLTTVIRGLEETLKGPVENPKGQVVERTRVRHFNARSGRGKRKKGGDGALWSFDHGPGRARIGKF